MTKGLIREKNKTIRESTIKDIYELYKKCKFKKFEGFIKINAWITKTQTFELYGRITGKSNNINEYTFPNLNQKIYGSCALILNNPTLIDINLHDWTNFLKNLTKVSEGNIDDKTNDDKTNDDKTNDDKTNDDKTNDDNEDDPDNEVADTDDDDDDDDEEIKDKNKNDEKGDYNDEEEMVNDFDNLSINDIEEDIDDSKSNSKADKYNLNTIAYDSDDDKFNYGSELSEDVYVYSSDEN